MVWFRVDDVLPFHERVIRAGNAAMGLWVRAGAWSSGQLTDGYIPADVARTMGTTGEVRRLVEVGLWHPVDGGYQFHAWAEDGTGTKRQPTRAEVEAQRRAERERKAAWRQSRRDHPEDVPPVSRRDTQRDTRRTDAGRPDTPTRPDPTLIERVSNDTLSPDAAEAAPGSALALLDARETQARAPRARAQYPAAFEGFWAAYPRREGKGDALKAWRAATQVAAPETIIAGAHRYAEDPNRDPAYTKHPGTWLRARGWEDEPLPARRPTSHTERQRDAVGRMFADLQAQAAPTPRGA